MIDYATLYNLTREDMLDSRDLEETITRLEAEQAEAIEDKHDGSWDGTDGAVLLDALRVLRAETEDDGWQYGIGFIRDNYFEDYARDFADDIGAVPSEYTWPTSCIDWHQAARDLSVDYSVTTIGGVSYWYRGA